MSKSQLFKEIERLSNKLQSTLKENETLKLDAKRDNKYFVKLQKKNEELSRIIDEYAEQIKDVENKLLSLKEREPSVGEIQEITILNTLQGAINNKANQRLVFRCCGKFEKAIELKGSCPYCGKDKIEVIRLWKYFLAQAIHKLIMSKWGKK